MTLESMRLLSRAFAALLLASGISASALAQSYPNQAVRVIVPFSPGGVTDIIARIAQAAGIRAQ